MHGSRYYQDHEKTNNTEVNVAKKKRKKTTKKHLTEDISMSFSEEDDFTYSGDIPTEDTEVKPVKKRKSWIPNGLVFGLLKFAIQKLIIKVPEEKKKKIAKAASKFVILLAREVAEGAARGIADGIGDRQ